ncbi:MAG: hypothetical protein AB7S75_04630 [Desulfococcaceae bacterium]
MAKKSEMDILDSDGRKPAKPASGKSSLLTVITLLWLAGLTAFVFMMLKQPQDSGLESRVAKLETKAAAVGGKIKKPGAENVENARGGMESGAVGIAGTGGADATQIAGLEQRLSQLEKNLAGLSATGVKDGTSAAGTPASVTATDAASIPSSAAYDEIKSKVDELEAKLLACDACAEKPVAKAAVTEKKPEPKKAVARAKKKAKPRVRTARRSPPAYKAPAPVAAAQQAVQAPQMGNYEHYDTVYDISMKVGPMYGHTDGDSIGYSRMAPGAAVHPTSNPTPDSSFAGTSTYYNKGLFE